ncbi:hypothetical protein [Acrocarpospora sp. B8E8]|uniref:hypothetical protein n=1 Tax=Acrocarpospora sp. B8E8 TaxID=3153572 RepID=UPI00325F1F99
MSTTHLTELAALESTTFEIQEIADLSSLLASVEAPALDGGGACSSSCSCSSCSSCSTSSTSSCSTGTSSGSCT